jgi:hypothetical protein
MHGLLLLAAMVAASVAVPAGTPPPSLSSLEPVSSVGPVRSYGLLSSSNWSGYAVSGKGFTSITGRWVVPTVTPSAGNTYSSSWVGIDGLFDGGTMMQTGTEQDFAGGVGRYYAWWEVLPAAETAIRTVNVQAGDVMTASIWLPCGSAVWTITITDVTRQQSFTTHQAYSGRRASAEWIEEAPLMGGSVASLAHVGTTVFGPGTINGADPAVIASDGGMMIQLSDMQSTPSAPDTDMDGFSVQYGSAAPAVPSS